MMPKPSILTIAASDASSGAGIQADLKTILAHGCYGTTAVTALTTTGRAVHPTPPEFISKQISSVLDEAEPTHAIKTGLLFSAETVKAVVGTLQAHYAERSYPPIVSGSPVSVISPGEKPDAIIEAFIKDLLPLAQLVTLNTSEAQLLLTHSNLPSHICSLEELVVASRTLLRLNSKAVLLRGERNLVVSMGIVTELLRLNPEITVVSHGQLSGNMEILQIGRTDNLSSRLAVDVLCVIDGPTTLFVRPKIDITGIEHGVGCTLTAAVASNLACGVPFRDAVEKAISYTYLAIQTADTTHGQEPMWLNHSHNLVPRILPQLTPTAPYPLTQKLIQGNSSAWKQYVEHDFVRLIGKGTLPRKAFIHFLIQGYKYLKYYARIHALFAAKSTSYKEISDATAIILDVVKVIESRSLYASFGITEEALESTPEAPTTTAYGAYLIDVGIQGDNTKLLMAPLACLLGYGEAGLWLKREAARPDSWVVVDGNPYKTWMDDYAGEAYQQLVKVGLDAIEARTAQDPASESRFTEWRDVWEHCVVFEKAFWDAAMAAA